MSGALDEHPAPARDSDQEHPHQSQRTADRRGEHRRGREAAQGQRDAVDGGCPRSEDGQGAQPSAAGGRGEQADRECEEGRTHPLAAISVAFGTLTVVDVARIFAAEHNGLLWSIAASLVLPYSLFRWGA